MAFGMLCTPPHPLTINLHEIDVAGLDILEVLDVLAASGSRPARGPEYPGDDSSGGGEVTLDELGAWLRSSWCSNQQRDALWRRLIRRARGEDPPHASSTWTVACAGLALPALIEVTSGLTTRLQGSTRHEGDIDAAVLAGFVEALGRVDLSGHGLLPSLRWAGFRAGLATLRGELDSPTPAHDLAVRALPPGAWPVPASVTAHPDFALARAVAAEVITPAEAELIGTTRIDGVALSVLAAARDEHYAALHSTRRRAERRLRSYLTDPDQHPDQAFGDRR